MAVPTFVLHSWENRRWAVPVFADADPTGNTAEFGVVASTETDLDPGSWTAGSWNGSYANGQAEAYTPTFGTSESSPSATVELTEGTDYYLMMRVRSGSDAPGGVVAFIKVE